MLRIHCNQFKMDAVIRSYGSTHNPVIVQLEYMRLRLKARKANKIKFGKVLLTKC